MHCCEGGQVVLLSADMLFHILFFIFSRTRYFLCHNLCLKILNFKGLYFPLIFFVGLRGKCLGCDFIFSKIRCVYRIYLDVNALQEIGKCCFLASKKNALSLVQECGKAALFSYELSFVIRTISNSCLYRCHRLA